MCLCLVVVGGGLDQGLEVWGRLCLCESVPCICLWQRSQIHTCLCDIVGPGFALASPAFMKSSASHPVCPPGQHGQNSKSDPIALGCCRFTICTAVCQCHCDSSTACRLCRLEHFFVVLLIHPHAEF